MLKSSRLIKVIFGLLISIVIVLVSYQLYNYFYLTIKTEYAVGATMEDTFKVNGIVCREETIIEDSGTGYHDMVLEDGEKVSKGGTLARVYMNETDVIARERIRQLQAQINEYTAAITAKSSYGGDNTAYDQQIQQSLIDFKGSQIENDAYKMQECLNSFEKSVFIKAIVSGDSADYQQVIDQLNLELSVLQKSLGSNVRNIKASDSGYFSRVVDGFENRINLSSLSEYFLQEYQDLAKEISENSSASSGALGKLVSGYEWNYYFTVSADKTQQYSVGDVLRLRFTSISDDVLEARVCSIRTENGQSLVGVTCTAQNSEYLSARSLEGEVIFKTYSGIRVDKNAVRIVDGKNGVYVKVGSIIKFKEVEILYMGTTYALVKEDNNGVVDFDEIVISGKGLFDGKVVS